MSLDVATAVTPKVFLANAAFTRAVTLASWDGSEYGAPEDVSDVEDVLVTALLRVARGETPPEASEWTLETGASLGTTTLPNEIVYPMLSIAVGDEGLAAGPYDVKVSFTRTGGTDFVLRETWDLVAQP